MVAGPSELWKVGAQLLCRADDLQSGYSLEKFPFASSRDFMFRGQGSGRPVDTVAKDGKSFG